MGIVPSSRSGVGRGGSARLRWWLVLWVLLDPRPQRRRRRQPQPNHSHPHRQAVTNNNAPCCFSESSTEKN